MINNKAQFDFFFNDMNVSMPWTKVFNAVEKLSTTNISRTFWKVRFLS
jgi:hypothetical protein